MKHGQTHLRNLISRLISSAEDKMVQFRIDSDSVYAQILAHARIEWAQGNYYQAGKDLKSLGII